MTEQPHLFPVGAQLRPLTDRQARILDMIRSVDGGIQADELGAMIHETRNRHMASERCEFCSQDGLRALSERAIRQRIVKRSGSMYEAVTDEEALSERAIPEPQSTDLPGTTWEDIFRLGDAA